MISSQRKNPLTLVTRHDSSAITNVRNIAHFLDNEHHNSTRSALISDFPISLDFLQKCCLSFRETCPYGFPGVFDKTWFFDDKLMQIISEVICAICSTMAVIYAKKWASWPRTILLIWLGLQDVQNNWHSVFIVVPDEALVGVSCVASNHSISLARCFGWLIVWDYNLCSRLEWVILLIFQIFWLLLWSTIFLNFLLWILIWFNVVLLGR